jgi:hypothetical protein
MLNSFSSGITSVISKVRVVEVAELVHRPKQDALIEVVVVKLGSTRTHFSTIVEYVRQTEITSFLLFDIGGVKGRNF